MIKYSYIKGIPFRFVQRYGNGIRFRIGETKHLVFLPKIYVNDDNTIRTNMNLDWFFKKYDTRHKLKLINGNFELETEYRR